MKEEREKDFLIDFRDTTDGQSSEIMAAMEREGEEQELYLMKEKDKRERERERDAQFMLSKKKEDGLEREKRRADTSFRWVNNQRLRLPRHTYGTTSNGRREKRQMNGDRRTWLGRGEVK